MKRSDALKLIANQLDFLNGRFKGFRSNFSEPELRNADVILTTLEQAGMQPPNITIDELIPGSGLKTDPSQSQHYYACWEPEEVEDPFDGKRSGAV